MGGVEEEEGKQKECKGVKNSRRWVKKEKKEKEKEREEKTKLQDRPDGQTHEM